MLAYRSFYHTNHINSSRQQIEKLKLEGKLYPHQTEFWFRKDPTKIHDKIGQEAWDLKLVKFEKFGVLDWMPIFQPLFFPGKEEEFKKIGLLRDDFKKEISIIGNDEEKDNEEDLDCI